MIFRIGLPILPFSAASVSFQYWRRQLTFIPASETLRRLVVCLNDKTTGAYLRFGRADIDAALLGGHTALALEVRKAFVLPGENIFKALQVECQALGLPSHKSNIPDREALERLNMVGACFLDAPIYSYNAFREDTPDLTRFLAVLSASQPGLVYKDTDTQSPGIERLAPRFSIAVPREVVSVPERLLDELLALENEILRMAAPAPGGFAVIVLAMGLAGRVLAKRLLLRGFPGFLVDMDDLWEIPLAKPDIEQVAPMPRIGLLTRIPRPAALPVSAKACADGKMPLRWEGPFLGHYSYSIINRELCSRLAHDKRLELSIQPGDTPFTLDPFNPAQSAGFNSIVERVGWPLNQAARVHISNHPQHLFQPPTEGRWVIIQPWDYVSLPTRWVQWINGQVDEVWVPGHFVRSAFLEAGIPAERVAVVPNGVNIRLYRPEARRVRLDTRKSFKFLFVGGPFWRKGFDLLLDAYGKAFSARNEVCLVIKSAPEFWTDNGTRMLAAFRSRSDAPEINCIIQTLDQVRMAGLYASCNCLVHPYRAEGFAMCVAEGMASRLPVIVTGMGATQDFCNPGTAYLVPGKLRHMNEKHIDHEPTLDYPVYAEPELDGLVDWMRYVYKNPHASQWVAQAGMNKIRAEFTWEHAADIAVQRLLALENQPIRRF